MERELAVQQIISLIKNPLAFFGSLKTKTPFEGMQPVFRRFGKRKGLETLSQ